MDAIDEKKLGDFLKQTSGMVTAGFNCAITVLGDRLDLYRGLAQLGPSSSEDLATHLGLHERWVREWLQQQACIGQVEYSPDNGQFSLTPEAYAC
mgnify:CR=1 FL=1